MIVAVILEIKFKIMKKRKFKNWLNVMSQPIDRSKVVTPSPISMEELQKFFDEKEFDPSKTSKK